MFHFILISNTVYQLGAQLIKVALTNFLIFKEKQSKLMEAPNDLNLQHLVIVNAKYLIFAIS